jgi:hypothetical protein
MSVGRPYVLPSSWYALSGCEGRQHVGDVGGDVLDQAGVDLLLEHAAAPRGEDVGRVARLRDRGQLGLVRLVLQDRGLDRDVRVLGLELLGALRPERLERLGGREVPPLQRHLCGRAARALLRRCLPATAAAAGQEHRGGDQHESAFHRGPFLSE